MNGVRVGPLDPDATAEFGQVAGKTSARQLVRHHVAMNPPALIGALTRSRNDARSLALDIEEVTSAVEKAWDEASEATPENFELCGATVRGAEDAEKVVTFTWRVPVEAGGTGRTGKGFISYDADALPTSVADGDEAVRIEKLKEAGLPWSPSDRALAAAGITGTGIAETAPENVVELAEVEEARDAALAEAEQSKREAEEAQQRVADLEAQLAAAGSAPPAETPEDDAELTEPWDGYDDSNADKIKAHLKNASDEDKVALADAVLKYEPLHGKRSGVIAAANAIADRQPAS